MVWSFAWLYMGKAVKKRKIDVLQSEEPSIKGNTIWYMAC